MELVIVTAWRRPAFLWASLTRIMACMPSDVRVVVSLDEGYHSEVGWVAERLSSTVDNGRIQINVRDGGHRRYRGNSHNVIEAYRDAIATEPEPELVHLIEDDVFIGYDYFDFHRRAHSLAPGAFSVSACRNQNFPIGADPAPDDTAVYSHGSYQSLGVSFRPEVLRSALEGVGWDYYVDMVGWCSRRFPNSAIPAGHAEQDGLLNRFREEAGMSTVYGATPRAYHAGFTGYNRKGAKILGSSTSDVGKQLLAMDARMLNGHAHTHKDHTTIDLDGDRASVSRLIEWP